MGQKASVHIRPLFSLLIIIFSLFTLVFLQMEVRRMGYVVLKQTRQYKKMQDEHRVKIMKYARIMRPERLRELAVSRFTLNEVKQNQIIHMSGENIALRR